MTCIQTTYATIKDDASNEEVSALPREDRDQIVQQWGEYHGTNARPTHSNASGQGSLGLKVVSHTHHCGQVD